MLTGSANGTRVLARSIAQSCACHVRICACQSRPGIRFPRWPSLSSLGQSSKLRSSSGSRTPRGQVSTARNLSSDQRKKPSDGDEYDEWNTIAALESSRKQSDWRHQLRDHDDYARESDLASPSAKLVSRYEGDFELLQELFVWRYRHHGPAGIRLLWKRIIQSGLDHKTRLWEFSRLWKLMEDVAIEENDLALDLFSHVKFMHELYQDKPDRIYERFMLTMLKNGTKDREQFHKSLRIIWPDRRELKAFFISLAKNKSALNDSKLLILSLPSFTGMYSFIIDHLTTKDMLDEAVDWHLTLVGSGDLPVDLTAPRQLIAKLYKKGRLEDASKVETDLTSRGITALEHLSSSSKLSVSTRSVQTTSLAEAMQVHLGQTRNFELSDQFISRLFATKAFSVDAVVQGLKMLNHSSIGPLAFREAILRIAHEMPLKHSKDFQASVLPGHVHTLIDLLEGAGLSVTKTTFSEAVVSAAELGRTSILAGIMSSDQHPESLEDIDIQEKLFAHYWAEQNRDDAEKVLFTIRIKDPNRYRSETDLDNIFLAIITKLDDKQYSVKVIDRILRRHGRIESTTFYKAWESNVSPRKRGKQAETYGELDGVVRQLVLSVRSGTRVSPLIWKETIKRLAWSKKFHDLENLCVWLVQWVLGRKFRFYSSAASSKLSEEQWTGDWYLREIFTRGMLQGMVAWGFLKPQTPPRLGKGSNAMSVAKPAAEDGWISMHERQAESLWGLRLLRKLRELGLYFDEDRREICKACELAIVRVYGERGLQKSVYRALRKPRRPEAVALAGAMEDIWGERLFLREDIESDDKARLTRYVHSLPLRSARSYQRGYPQSYRGLPSTASLPQDGKGDAQ